MLFSTTAEKFIGYTAFELFQAVEKNAPMNDDIARKIDKKRVLCFLKDCDRSFESRFERTFPVVALYAEDEAESGLADEPSILSDATAAPNLQECASATGEKEKQLFSPSTKRVIDEIATTVGMEQRTFSSATVKRGIVFHDRSIETEDTLGEKVPSPTYETVEPVSGL